ncbi:glycosyltransferase [Nocardia seriolae]|uniref:Mannosyltransferase n=1 Tax=Nocardia seriolae TaxID=37332 RepID=A0ABC8AZX8_9NOCA|nr:Undecaprenyl-phosphate 4-deoxy-4-formamido-L-arabinose transferase [Nocardia seriolae]GEM25629.1 glycosyl transferase [Nocardia seriolae NBRC 15557]QOW34666.1 glycosyltransferase [Nocardia seriolae]QUN17867.1 glycosyltransferase [Nocardia seriolae]BEK87377.1 glycosyltransferase family 2 protein [Nocardia seriolae]
MPIPSARTHASDPNVTSGSERPARVHAVSVVVPVYRGEETIAALVSELDKLGEPVTTPRGATFRVEEIVLVHDHGPDRSDVVLQELAATYPQVRVVWLSRNYGQDAATIAGMAAAQGDWTVTMDEDGQHDPAFIADFLDAALSTRADLVYSKPVNTRPHGFLRNITSRGAKLVLATLFAFPDSTRFESYRLIRGDIARQLARVASNGVYLDVALTWVVGEVAQVPVQLRAEGREESGYNYRRLFSLFWKMVLCSGTRGLRLVSMLGLTLALGGLGMAGWVVYHALTDNDGDPAGWASLMTVLLLCSGAVLFSLGLIAEYLGVALHVLVGKPLYLTVETPTPRPGQPLSIDDDSRFEPAGKGFHAREQ